jgi:hypothetical protein
MSSSRKSQIKFHDMTVNELRNVCRVLHISRFSKLRKQELINLCKNYQDFNPEVMAYANRHNMSYTDASYMLDTPQSYV